MADNDFRRDASHRLAFEMAHLPWGDYSAISREISTRFDLRPDPVTFALGLDGVVMDFLRDELIVELAWDVWSGFVATAKSQASEYLVQEIGDWLLSSEWATRAAES